MPLLSTDLWKCRLMFFCHVKLLCRPELHLISLETLGFRRSLQTVSEVPLPSSSSLVWAFS